MKPVGGYFGLEIQKGTLPYSSAVPVNFGRGGLELIVLTRGYKRVWLPDYICPVVPQCLLRLGLSYALYRINNQLEPTSIPGLEPDEAFLYVDYFGIKDEFCRTLERTQKNLILDLTQAFYYEPIHTDGFNSCRKFFGVPDGGFVFGTGLSDVSLADSVSYDRCEALLRRADGDVPGGYSVFQRLDESLCELSAAKMSQLTRTLMSSCDLVAAAYRRKRNYTQLHTALKGGNRLSVGLASTCVPLVYPLLVPNGAALKKNLIGEKVFCPTYWPGIAQMGDVARNLVENLVCVPVDQRYDADDMSRMVNLIKGDRQ